VKAAFISMFLLAGCGSPQPPPPPPHANPVAAPAAPLAEAAPAETGVFVRLRQVPGPVPGLTGYTIAFVPDQHYCGGFRIETKRGTTAPSSDEQPLADVFAIEFPQLDFSKDPHEAAKTFGHWMDTLGALGEAANKHYTEIRAHADELGRLEASARNLQVRFRLAAVIARARIPSDALTGEYVAEKVKAFCDQVRATAEPMVDSFDKYAESCAEAAAKLGKHGWWDAVCAPASR
jgi:hypothetical protein